MVLLSIVRSLLFHSTRPQGTCLLKTRFAASISVVGGLFTSQIIATLQVFLSNLALYEKMSWIARAGYLTVPNQNVLPTLKMFSPAFHGGLFFSLSIGVGITLASLVCVWVWKYLCGLRKAGLYFFLGLWALLTAALNWHGFVLMPSLYVILIPAVVVTLFLILSPDTRTQSPRMTLLLHLLAISVLALLWSTQMNSSMYINIRDNLLLSNTAGIRFNNFYYHYTLYPAEVFRNLNQKLIKTYHLQKMSNRPIQKRLEHRLNRYNYLPISEKGRADVEITLVKDRIRLIGSRHASIETPLDLFFEHTRNTLQDLSRSNDAYIHFRGLTSLSLLVGFPLMLYWIFNGLLIHIFSSFFGRQTALIAGIAVCCLLGTLLLFLMPGNNEEAYTHLRLAEMLASDDWKETVTALKYINTNKLDLYPFKRTTVLSRHPSIPVRYWLARGLSVGKHSDDETHLITLMQDPHPNVACQAFYSIGKRKFRTLKPMLLEAITVSDHWYVQLYTYNALRKLGWKQTPSN
jgi:hypothetical protein